MLPFRLVAGEMRQAYLEKVESQKMKQKARERMQPKMGKLDIDYQVRMGGRVDAPSFPNNHSDRVGS